jgi:hypothetical protein
MCDKPFIFRSEHEALPYRAVRGYRPSRFKSKEGRGSAHYELIWEIPDYIFAVMGLSLRVQLLRTMAMLYI